MSFAKLVTALRERLIKTVIKDASRVYVIAQRPAEKLPPLSGERDLIIRVRGFMLAQSNVEAGGTSDTPVRRTVDIVLRSRCSLDRTGTDAVWLLKEAAGHLDFEDQVFNAVQVWTDALDDEPDDYASQFIEMECEPVRLSQASDAVRDFRSTDGSWGSTVLTVEFVYRQQNEVCR